MLSSKSIAGGKLNVAIVSASDYFFPHLIVEFARRHPCVKLNLAMHNRAGLLGRLSSNRTDLAVVVRPPPQANAAHAAFAPHLYVIASPAGGQAAHTGRTHRSGTVRGPRARVEYMEFNGRRLGAHLEQLNVAMEIHSTDTIMQAVIAGMVAAFLSAHTISQELKACSLVVLDGGVSVMSDWYVAHPSI